MNKMNNNRKKSEKENYFQVSPVRMHNSEISFFICGNKEKIILKLKLEGRQEKFSVVTAASEATEGDRGDRCLQDRSEDPSKTDCHLDSRPTNKRRKSLADSIMCTVVWRFCKTAKSFIKSVYLHGTTRFPMN